MSVVNHKLWGMGTVIKREITKDGNYLTVRFVDGREVDFAIPSSFEKGFLTAVGALNDEVEAALDESRALEEKKKAARSVGVVKHSSVSGSKKTVRGGKSASASVKGVIEEAYEDYLIKAGYKIETDDGDPSTVYSYINAIKNHVLENEGISWSDLKNDIDNIVKIYGKGGAKELIGAKSNSTVINALMRFKEFVNQ